MKSGCDKAFERERLLTFQTLQQLTINFNSCLAPIVFPALQYFQTATIVFSNFSVIQYHSQLDLFILILMCFYSSALIIGRTAIYYRYGAAVFTRSMKLLTKYRTSATLDKAMKKSWIACMPLKIIIGPFNFIRRESPFLSFGVILYFTMKMIIAF